MGGTSGLRVRFRKPTKNQKKFHKLIQEFIEEWFNTDYPPEEYDDGEDYVIESEQVWKGYNYSPEYWFKRVEVEHFFGMYSIEGTNYSIYYEKGTVVYDSRTGKDEIELEKPTESEEEAESSSDEESLEEYVKENSGEVEAKEELTQFERRMREVAKEDEERRIEKKKYEEKERLNNHHKELFKKLDEFIIEMNI